MYSISVTLKWDEEEESVVMFIIPHNAGKLTR